MEIVLYIVLGSLAAAAVAMQVWMLVTGREAVGEQRRPLLVFLRVLNIALILVAAGLVAYLLARR